MSGLRFKAGERAIYVVAWGPEAQWAVGNTVTIETVGPLADADGIIVDYIIDCTGDRDWGSCFDWQLRKIDPPTEPASLTRTTETEVTA